MPSTSLTLKTMCVYGGMFALVGLATLLITKAATDAISLDAENGHPNPQISVVIDTNAAGGTAIKFASNQPSVTTLPNPGTWTDVTSNLVGLSSDCGTISSVYTVPGSNKVIAGVARRGLWVSANDGGSWTQMPGSTIIVNRPTSILFDPNDSNTFWEAGYYDWPGVNKTVDGGTTFQSLGSAADLHTVRVDFTDPSRQRLLAGARRRSQEVWKTTDGGANWTNIGLNIPSGTGLTTDPIFINATTYLVNSDASFGETAGVYRTTDGGATWQRVTTQNARSTPLVASDGTIYWPSNDGLIKSTDSGQSWTRVGSGLRDNVSPIELPDGRLVSTTGSSLVVSADGGSTWTSFGAAIPPTPSGASGFFHISYSTASGAFYAEQFTCESAPSPVHAGAIMRLK